jgi:hypothetical protein
MEIGTENRSTGIKPASMPPVHCDRQTVHGHIALLSQPNMALYEHTHAHSYTYEQLTLEGRAIALRVSRRLPTTAARIRPQVRSRGVCSG